MERVLPRTLRLGTGSLSLRRLVELLHLWHRRARTRRQLAALDEHQLSDIGISRSERMAELEKPFWR
ncbi:DUF1127 domain-containing protein [Pseudomonas sp. KSR10]|jgi:uncharacterized protein YjiS (DUF1127 family)|uniref:YjiS-like domain-containing protein n=1 Tax=Stutzerimonas stutzeri TaxID=316 RepID=A0A0D9AVI8_STUST|nr:MULTISPECIES: DUF1127 domain-containing protein [Pseudomonadaceae]KJH85023.1 hypothetical protein UF78_00670 [Stutzerimonas stutzeri]MCG6542859.1 DUF1127 domain-containing protein [Pseudomonas sp. KSR10]